MKTIKQLNTFAIGLPFLILLTYPIAKDEAFINALVSTSITGFIQVILAVKMIFSEPRNTYLQIYTAGVILFFYIYLFNLNIYYINNIGDVLFCLPLLLAIYLSVIIYKKTSK
jgi:hypothetical protein